MAERSTPGRSDRSAPAPSGQPGDAAPADAPERTAVALTYAPETADSAPVVSASGRGHLAERIIETAREAGIPIREDADLVEILAATEVGDEIPVEAFIAVAEILRYVYEANGTAPPQPSDTGPRPHGAAGPDGAADPGGTGSSV